LSLLRQGLPIQLNVSEASFTAFRLQSNAFNADFDAGEGGHQNTLKSIGFRLRTIELHEGYTANTKPTSFPLPVVASTPASNSMYLMLILKLMEADIKTH
jgi:hypothetical protein